MKMHMDKYTWAAKVGEKGQIVIPKEARELFDITPGETLLLLGDEARGIIVTKNNVLMKFAEIILKAQKEEQDEITL